MIRSNLIIRLCLVLFVLIGAQAAVATSITSTSGNVIYVDSAGNVNPNLLGNYASFNVTNTGAAIADAWVTLGNFTPGFISLGINENGLYHLGPMASGASRSVFFYLTVDCSTFQAGKCNVTTPQSYTVSLYSGPPTTNLLAAQIFSVTVLDTTAASANKVTSVVTSSNNPTLGAIVTVTTTGNTGTINNTNDIFFYSPATYFDWPASSFRLHSTTISFVSGGSATDQLLVPTAALPPSASDYTMVATYLVQGPTATPTAVSPVAFIGSGTQIKHTDTSKFASSFPPIGTTSNSLTLSKLASPSTLPTGGTTTFTLRATNTSASTVSLDDFVDTLPNTPGVVTYVVGSSKFAGSSIPDPTISGNTLTWTGIFNVPANGTADLTFTASVPNTGGSYVNSAVGHIGSTQIDTTLSTADNAFATVTLSVGSPDLTIAKTHTGNFSQGQTGATYTITASNIGSGPTSGTVTVTDTLPSGLTATAISGTGWSCTLGTLTCTRSDALAASSSYPAITLTVNVANNAAASVTNSASVSGGGETNTANDSASDPTTVTQLPDLTIAKTHTGNFTQGQTGATYTITASNIGSAPTSGAVTVTDTLPTGLTVTAISGTGWSCTLGTLTCTRSDALAAGGSYPAITLTVNVANNAAASVTNSANVSGGGETNTSNDSASDPTTVTQLPDLTIAKTHTGNFTQGQTGATYTITASNIGSAPTSGTVTVTDTLPTGLTATAISGTGWSCTLGTLTCTRSDALAASSSYPAITLTVNVASNASASLTNSANVSGGGETNTANDSAGDPTTVTQLPDLTIAKTHTGNFTQGQTGATYTITVSNIGPGPTNGTVTVTDTLPSGLTATAISGTGWSCTLGTLTCTRSDALAASSSYPAITLTVNVASNASASLTNSANVSGGGETNTANDSAGDPTTVTQLPDLTIAKTHTGNFTQGQTGATYTITVSNIGSGPTSGTVTVTDTLPTGLTATAISGTGWSCTLGTLTCTRSDALAASSSYPAITLTVNVANNAAASVTNSASVSGGGETNTANDSASDPTTVTQLSDLTISKTHTGNFTQGQTGATYTITVSNIGPGPTNGTVTVTDTLPTGLTATAISGTGWSCTLGTLTCTRSDALAASSSYPAITLTVNVANNAASSLTNSASVSGGGETNTANDSASDPTTVTQLPDLTIAKTHTGNFTQGQTGATYTITASNIGSGPTSGTVTVTDTLPTGLTATAISGTGWSCTLGTLTCMRSDALAASSSYPSITLTVNVANNAASSLTNSASVSGGGETNTANDSASDPTTVTQLPDLTIAKTHTGNFTQGQTGATYTITVSNIGSGPTSGTVTVTDTLPSGLTATAISGTGWSCTLGTLTCTRADALAASSSYPSITLTVNVANNAASSLTNSASVSGGGETNTANDSASDPTTVTQLPDLTVAKTHTGNFTQGQTGATYTITASNIGSGPTSGTVTVTDTLPSGLTATAISGTGWSCTLGTLTCTRSDALAASSSYPAITLTVNVANNAAASVTNSASVSGGGETNTANDSASDPTTVTQLPDLTIAKTHTGNFTQGQTGATYTITVSNIGSGPTSGTVTATDTLPSGLTATAISGTGWSCTLGTLTCTRSDALAASSSYPAITLAVNVASNASASLTNSASVSGGGETNTANDSASDPTTVTQLPDLTIAKTHTGNFTQGQTGATYTITASNIGSGPTSGTVTVTDTLPTGLTATAISGTGWSCTLGTLTCTRSDALAASSSYPAITLTVNVANNAAASVTNSVSVSGGGETNTGNDTSNDATTINPLSTPDLTLTKTHTGNFTQGQTGATYTITVSNVGSGPTSGTVTATDTLPSGLTATAISGTGWSCTLGTLTCTRADALAASSNYPAITLTVNVANNAAASVTNSASVSGGGETNTANDSASDPTTVTQLPDLTIAKTHTGNFSQGQTGAIYTITVSNIGPGPTSGTVTVTDTLPTGLTATAISGTGWSCTLGTLTCTRADALAASSNYPAITLTVNVANNAAASVTNSASVSGGGETNTANDSASDPTTVTQLPDLTIAKTHTGNFTQGQTGATYTITVSNIGPGPTSGTVTVTDTLPTGLTATAISGTGWSCTLGTLTCTRADALAASSNYPAITLTVNVANNAATSVTNSASVSGGGETNTANDSANDPTTVTQLPDLTIAKTHTGNFTQGQTGATYTITVSNIGPGPTSGTVTVTDTLPTGLTATAISGTGWSCTLGTLTCTRADALAASSNYPAITLTVNVANNAAASVTNSASVSGGGETNTANDSSSDATTINPTLTPDLTIAKTHTGNFTQGQTGATYTITVSNVGSGPTSGTVTATDTLPSGLTATAISGTGWSCTLGTLTCTRADALAASSNYPAITLTVNVANNAAASVTNSASVSGGGETNTSNDSASDPTTVTQLPDLTIAKTHTGNFTQGQIGATYTITVSNVGSGPTSGTVTVTDTLPSGLTATAISGTGWSCTLGTLTCTRADALAASSNYPAITLTVNVASNAAASVTNSASVSGGGETNTANDSSSDATTINPALTPDLTLAKTHTGNFTQGQTGATYTITVSNIGPGPTSGTVTVTDTLPSGLTATAISGTGWSCTLGTLTCTRADALAASSSYPAITLTVNVANNAAASVTNSASVSGGGETNTANDSSSDATTINPALTPDLTIAKTHTGNFTQGQTGATYTITVSNVGSGPTNGTVTVTDTLPSGLTATAISGTGWSCTLGTLTCTRSDALAASSGYPAITLTVNVASNAAASVTNSASVSGGGETNTANDSASDPTTVTQLPDLTIAKTHTGNFTQGQIGATYTITVSNIGSGPTSGTVTVTDTLPSGLTATAISGTGWSCILGTLTCTRSDALAASSSYPAITLTVNVANNAAASVTNSASVSGAGETNTANDLASDATTINPALTPDLIIAKTHTGNFTQGQTGATYTITVSNVGSGPTNGTVTVTDTLPTGLTATAISGTGWSCTLGTLTCTRSDALAASSSYPTITLTVNVASNAAVSVTNSASVSGGGETNTANDSSSDSTTINPALTPDLTIAKTHTGNFTQGQTGAPYTITVSNIGSGPTSGTVTVTDTLPSGLTATAVSGTGWSCTLGTLTCTRSDALAASSSYPAITLTVNVANNAAATVTNSASVSGGGETNTANDSSSDATTINPALTPDLTIAKTHTGNFTQGQTGATYTITVSNIGSGPTAGTVTVTDTLPSGLTATAISGTGWSCTLGTLTCTRSDALAASSSYPAITLTVNVANNAAASVTNSASVSGGGETNTANDSSSDATTINPALTPDLTIAKTHTGNFTQGQTGATYTITVSNIGSGPTTGTVTVTDTLPSGLTATAVSGTGWSCTLGTLTCTRSDALAASSSYPAITLTVSVANSAAASVTNSASVSGGGETNTGNDTANDPTTINSSQLPKLAILKTHSGNFTQGQTGATYTITASNTGPVATSGAVTVADTLPAGLTGTAISGPGWSCTLPTLSCTRSDALAAGGSYPAITLVVSVASNAAAALTNVATVSGGGASSSSTANDATVVTAAIVVRPDQLRIKKSVDRSFVDTGDVPLYTIQVTNLASVAVENAQIHDHLPNGFQFVLGSARIIANASDSAPVTPVINGNDLVFTIGHLAANANVLLTYRVRVAATAAFGENTNTAFLTAISGGATVTSAQATAVVNVGRGIMSTRQVIVGRVFEDVNGNGLFDAGDRPIAGARIYLSNGQSVVTDSAGLYSIPSVREGSVVVSLDPITLPTGLALSDGGRKDGRSWTRLLRTPIGGGGLLRQNFSLQRISASAPSNPAPSPTPSAGVVSSSENRMTVPNAEDRGSGDLSKKSLVAPDAAAEAGIQNKPHLEISAQPASIPADGRSVTIIRIRAVDDHGRPLKLEHVRIRTSEGQFAGGQGNESGNINATSSPASSPVSSLKFPLEMGAPDGPRSASDVSGGVPLASINSTSPSQISGMQREMQLSMSNGEATVRLISGNTPGTAKLEAEAGDFQNPLMGQTEVYFSPEQRSAILVALGELSIGRAAPDFAFTRQSGDFSRRADFFFRKSIFGNNLLTLGYTSDSSVNAGTGINQMFQLDPLNRVYPVFGDSSTLFDAAQANSHVYGRLDHGRSYLLFGDLRGDVAHDGNSNVSDYSRNLTGLKAHWENSQKDQLTVTGARPQTSFARDVFAGDTFGLIHLSHTQILPGSEMIAIEIRDRRNPEVLVSREPLVRSVDYSLDTNSGSIFFLRPVTTLDASLNLVQLIVTYEFQNVGLSSSVYSAQGSKRFAGSGTRIGASFLTERDAGIGDFYLSSMELEQILPNKGRLHVELPVSYGTVLTAGSFFGSTDGSASANGMAVRATLDQPFNFMKGTAHLAFSRTDDGFTNPFGATTLPGSQIARASVELSPIRASRLQLGFIDERNDTSLVENQRQTAFIQWKQPLGEKLDLTAGYDYRNFRDAVNPRQVTSDLVSAGLDWRVTSRLQASVRREQNLTDSDPTYPSQTLLAARYQISDVSRLFLTQRFSSAPIIPISDLSHSGFTSLNTTQETTLGIETRWQKYTSLTSRYQIENGINGTDSFAVLGVVTRIPVSQHFSTDLGMERGSLISGRGTSYDSGRVGLSWLPNDRYRATVRYELRDQGGLGQILSVGNAGKINDDITVLGQFTHSYAAFTGNTTPYLPAALNSLNNATQGTAALAYRPLKSDRAGLLFSYTLRQMQLAGVPNFQNDNVGLLSADGYYQAARNLEFYGKVALSHRTARIDNGTDLSTKTFLYQGRTQIRISHSFDAAAETRFVVQPVTDTQRWSLGNEVGYWVVPDLRLALGYNYKSIDEYRANFLANPVRRGVYFVMSTKLSHLFDLFGTPKEGLLTQK